MGTMDETSLFGMDQVCPLHGDEYMKECSMCGAEFCRLCHPNATVCPDCAAAEEDGELDEEQTEVEEPDFDDVEDLVDILEDEDLEKLEEELEEEERQPSPRARPKQSRRRGRKKR